MLDATISMLYMIILLLKVAGNDYHTPPKVHHVLAYFQPSDNLGFSTDFPLKK